MVCCAYFNIKKGLGVDVLGFQFELFGHICKYWANFCSIFRSLCFSTLKRRSNNFKFDKISA
jgi:hypothetical protein